MINLFFYFPSPPAGANQYGPYGNRPYSQAPPGGPQPPAQAVTGGPPASGAPVAPPNSGYVPSTPNQQDYYRPPDQVILEDYIYSNKCATLLNLPFICRVLNHDDIRTLLKTLSLTLAMLRGLKFMVSILHFSVLFNYHSIKL